MQTIEISLNLPSKILKALALSCIESGIDIAIQIQSLIEHKLFNDLAMLKEDDAVSLKAFMAQK